MTTEGWAGLPGRLIVISGPSGSGKSTLARRVLGEPGVVAALSVSATTRAPRGGEVEGSDYYFLGRPAFEAAVAAGEFLEWAEVHGNLYGTPAGPVRAALADGRCVILEIDVQGGFQVKARVPSALMVFVHPPSLEILEGRLRGRAQDDEAVVRRRLANALGEIEQSHRYDVQLVNDDLERAVGELAGLIQAHGCKTGG